MDEEAKRRIEGGCACGWEALADPPDAYEDSDWKRIPDPNCPVHKPAQEPPWLGGWHINK